MATNTHRTPRPREVLHDQTPSITTDHPFEPKGEWWSLCKHCNLAESTHAETVLNPIRYLGDDEDE
jgi:hypothetical protein